MDLVLKPVEKHHDTRLWFRVSVVKRNFSEKIQIINIVSHDCVQKPVIYYSKMKEN